MSSIRLALLLEFSLLAVFYLSCQASSDWNVQCPKFCNCTIGKGKRGVGLYQVDCSGHGLSEIPDGIPRETQVLKLNNNQISAIAPGKLGNLSVLDQLYINDNKLTDVSPGALKGLDKVTKIYMSRNSLTNFPDICADVGTTLAHLGLDENQMTGSPVPGGYAKCTALLSLILTKKNKFPQLNNDTLAALKSPPCGLQSLKLNEVGIAGIQAGALIPVAGKLKDLDLSTNPALSSEDLSAAFRAAPFSKEFVGLTLKAMGWAKLPAGFLPKGSFPRLDILHLDCSGAGLSSLDPRALEGATTLTQLFLNGCPIESLDAELTGLEKLKTLNLAGTRLSTWTANTFGPSLTHLDLSGAQIAVIGGLDGSVNPLLHLGSFSDNGLRIDGNSLVCNCSLLWLTQQLQDKAISKKFFKLDNLYCSMPNSARVKLTELKLKDCNSTTTTTAPSTTSTVTTDTPSTTTSTSITTTSVYTTTSKTAAPTTSAHGGGGGSGGGTTPGGLAGGFPAWASVAIAASCAAALLLAVAFVGAALRRRRQQRFGYAVGSSDLRSLIDESPGSGSGGCMEMFRRGGSGSVPESPEQV